MARKPSLTNTLYSMARFSADVRAARKGPVALGKRLVRKQVYRAEGTATRRLLRKIGL
jgi:hypothetical protein